MKHIRFLPTDYFGFLRTSTENYSSFVRSDIMLRYIFATVKNLKRKKLKKNHNKFNSTTSLRRKRLICQCNKRHNF